MPAKKVVIATNNAHKLEEISRMLTPVTGWEFVSLKDCGSFPEPVEDADDFEGNARIKALAARDNTGLPALADDSGLVVDALDGAPGVFSSRFAGESATDADNNAKLLELLADVPDDERTARFVCTLVFVDTDDTCPMCLTRRIIRIIDCCSSSSDLAREETAETGWCMQSKRLTKRPSRLELLPRARL